MKKRGGLPMRIANFDFLSPDAQLNIGGRASLPTVAGSAMSLVCLAIMSMLTWSIMSSYFDKSSPKIITKTKSTAVSPSIEMGKYRHFPIVFFSFTNGEAMNWDQLSEYVYPVFIHTEFNSNPDGTHRYKHTKFQLVPCSKLYLDGKLDSVKVGNEGYVKSNYLKTGFCVDTKGKKISMGNQKNTANPPNDFGLYFFPCTKTDNTCKEASELNQIYFEIATPKAIEDFSNHANPIQYYTRREEFLYITYQQSTSQFIWLNHNKILESGGLMSQKTIKHEYTSIESEYSSVFMRDPAETTCLISNTDSCIPYYTLRFRATNLEIETTREYKGLLESISEVGGMLFIVMLVFKSVCGIYHQLTLRQHLIREVFAVSSKKGIEYDKAAERLDRSLDIINILKDLHLIKALLVAGLERQKNDDIKINVKEEVNILEELTGRRIIEMTQTSPPDLNPTTIIPPTDGSPRGGSEDESHQQEVMSLDSSALELDSSNKTRTLLQGSNNFTGIADSKSKTGSFLFE